MTDAATRPSGHQTMAFVVAVVAELIALALGVSANLYAVWRDDTAQIWAAGAIPVVMLVATYLFLTHHVPVVWQIKKPGGAKWWANVAAAAAIIVPIAMTSYWHQRVTLLGSDGYGNEHGLPTLLATLLPISVDGLAIRAALTLWASSAPAAQRSAHGGSAATTCSETPAAQPGHAGPDAAHDERCAVHPDDDPALHTAPDPEPEWASSAVPSGGERPTKDRARDWYIHQLQQGQDPTPAEVNRAVGASATYIRRPVLDQWRTDLTEDRTNGHRTDNRS